MQINASLSHQLLHADSQKNLCKRKNFLLLCITTKPKRKASWTNMARKGSMMLFLDPRCFLDALPRSKAALKFLHLITTFNNGIQEEETSRAQIHNILKNLLSWLHMHFLGFSLVVLKQQTAEPFIICSGIRVDNSILGFAARAITESSCFGVCYGIDLGVSSVCDTKKIAAYLKGLSKYRRMVFLKYLFSFLRYWRFLLLDQWWCHNTALEKL